MIILLRLLGLIESQEARQRTESERAIDEDIKVVENLLANFPLIVINLN